MPDTTVRYYGSARARVGATLTALYYNSITPVSPRARGSNWIAAGHVPQENGQPARAWEQQLKKFLNFRHFRSARARVGATL